MTTRYRYGIIGTGIPWKSEGATGFGMANPHYTGFMSSGRADLVCTADIRKDHADMFLKRHNCTARVYADYREMLSTEKPDIVSICYMAAPACRNGYCSL